MIGSYHEQRSAIEASTLAAAKDLSAIVINDPNFGYIGLSDSAPIGTSTAAGDGYFTSVTGINTLLGTIRLDLIIADYLQDPIMTQLAMTDYCNALTAQQNLVTALTNACAANGTGTDANGNTINPTADAISAYNNNNVHLAIGQTSSLVTASLALTLGYVTDPSETLSGGGTDYNPCATRTAIPQPASAAAFTNSSTQQINGFYAANIDIPYSVQNTVTNGSATVLYANCPSTTNHFVFAALGPNATLVDFRVFQSSVSGLAYSTPTVVKVDADEQYVQSGGASHTVHATAAALAGTIVDQRPNPGAFTIAFTDPPPPELNPMSPGVLINNAQIQADPTDMMQSPTTANSDYPEQTTAMTSYQMAFLPDPTPYNPLFTHVLSVAFYDWIRRAGTNVNVQNLVTTMGTPLNMGAGGPQLQLLHITSAGNVYSSGNVGSSGLTCSVIPWTPVDFSVSNNQYRAISGLGLVSSNGNSYDLEIDDYCRVPGLVNGGWHAGEPLNYTGTTGSNPLSASYVASSITENYTLQYQEYLSGSGIRPTYNSEGIAANFTVRMRH